MSAQKTLLRTSVLFVALAFVGVAISGCTKAKEQKSMVSPDAYVDKTAFEGKTFHLVRGFEEADSENSMWAVPGFSNDQGLVSVRITETELQFVNVFDPLRRNGTQVILASYPIRDHFDIIREVNDFGESTNKIVENKDKPWSKRAFMRVDWANPSNSLSEIGSSDLGPSVRPENIVLAEAPSIEKDGHVSWLTEFSGIKSWAGISFGSPSRIYIRTHLMPVKASDFVPLHYREKDFKRFGYFYTQQDFEDPEKGLLDSALENNTFANIHNVCEPGKKSAEGKALSCSTNKIVWRLNKGFPQKFLEVTRRAVSEWNDVFKKALGRSDDVVVLDESAPVDLIDPRVNTIALYPHKASGGLLGVAQEVVNPITGETIASRATVYEDGIRGQMGWVDEIITLILADPEIQGLFLATEQERRERLERIFAETGGMKFGDPPVVTNAGGARMGNLRTTQPANIGRDAVGRTNRRSGAVADLSSLKREARDLVSEPIERSMARKKALMKKAPGLYAVSELAKIGGSLAEFDQVFSRPGAKPFSIAKLDQDGVLPEMAGLESLHEIGPLMRAERARVMSQAEKGIHGTELVEEAALRYIIGILASSGNVADFQSQVNAIKQNVEQMTYYTTLLHEMGHTFGLRHNFAASSDEKHYSERYFEIKERVEKGDKSVAAADYAPYMFSSIMDYGGDFYSQVGGLGAYDKAAIKYAYNRSIDRENDEIVKAGFKFCTDHEADESILCRRFDKGRNVSEVTMNLIESYQLNWVLSHFRRDRANFGSGARSYPMRAMGRYFIPIRQVMDEYLYALIDSKSVAAKQSECSMDYWRRSVDAGEIVNVCDPLEAERNGVDITDLASFSNGLLKLVGTGQNSHLEFRKEPGTLSAYGLADLVLANQIALNFFTDVIGSTEPGRFVAIFADMQSTPQLERLTSTGSVEDALREFISQNGEKLKFMATVLRPENGDDFAKKLAGFTGEIRAGRYAKPFNSEPDESGVFPRQKNIGAFWDKYVAMIALGLKDIGVEKYARRSMTGNSYVYPQTKAMVANLFRSIITQKGRIASTTLRTANGKFKGAVEPSFNRDMQAIATLTALTDFVADGDKSIVDRLRICSSSDQGCESRKDGKVIEFTTSSGQTRYRAAQTDGKDSIAFDLLSEAAELSKAQSALIAAVANSSNQLGEAIMNVADDSETSIMRKKLEVEFAPQTAAALDGAAPNAAIAPNGAGLLTNSRGAALTKLLLSENQDDGSAWLQTKYLAEHAKEMGPFSAINLATGANSRIQASFGVLQEMVQETDPEQKCGELGLEGIGADGNAAASGSAPAAMLNNAIARLNTAPGGTVGNNNRTGANGNNAAGSGGNNGNAAARKACASVIEARKPIVEIANKILRFVAPLGKATEAVVQTKLAPIQLKRQTETVARSEANILFIREVSKAIGLE